MTRARALSTPIFSRASSRAPKAKAQSRYCIRSTFCAMSSANWEHLANEPHPAKWLSTADASRIASAQERKLSLLSFELGEQEYALPLDRVREIIQLPQNISEVARSETAVLGVVTLRDQLLPLVSLRALLGMPLESGRKDPGKVVVLPMGGGAVGVVTDRTREILHVSPETIDPAPALLTRGEGDAEITSICRLDQGRRLVALLSPDNLFRSDLVRRVLSEQNPASDVSESQIDGDGMADEQFIIFRLGDQEYGIAIAAVDEIARLPEQIVRLPKAPAFIDGVINMRGVVVPIVDLRRRFDIASLEAATSRRILVLSIGGGKTGFIVDGVSEVMKIPADAISPTPEISTEQMRLVGRVANLDSHNRMILLVDAAQLLDRIEADVLAKFDRRSDQRCGSFVIKLLIADDSALMRKLLEGIFQEEGDFDIRLARNGNEALELVRSFDPQVVTLDVQMPGMDGLSCLSQIMIESPRPVVMISALTEEGADATLEAIELGAVDFVAKPKGLVSLEIDQLRPILIEKMRGAAQAKIRRTHRLTERIRHQFSRHRHSSERARAPRPTRPLERANPAPGLVLIGSSTGGPAALDIVLPQLAAGSFLACPSCPAHALQLHGSIRQAARPCMRIERRRSEPPNAIAARHNLHRAR